jgi:formylglycine-generating enzyme required for sulfatase activity
MSGYSVKIGLVSMICLIAILASALERSELSPEAQALIPPGRTVVIETKTGEKVQGTVVMDAPDKIVLRVKLSETVTGSKPILKQEIKSMKEADISEIFGAKLLELPFDISRGMPMDECKKLKALYEEYLQKCKGGHATSEIQARYRALSDYMSKMESGMELIAGEWHSPVSATIRKYDLYSRAMELMRRQPNFMKDLKPTYDRIAQERRALARALPKLMQERIPELLKNKQFDDAVAEVTAFMQFFIHKVIPAEGELKEFYQQVDFEYIVRMQKQIVKAYTEAGFGADKPSEPVPEGMIFIPGGYMLMGREDAKPGDPDFPMHIVYVSPFFIDKHEVTNEEYRKFVEHVKQTGDYSSAHPDAPPLKKHDAKGWEKPELSGDKQPVVGVDWFDAYAYAKWKGKRLPTEAEWEKAARSSDGRLFPWGNDVPADCTINWAVGRQFLAAEMDRQNPPQPVKRPGSFGCAGCVKEELPPPPPTTLPSVTWNVNEILPPQVLSAIASQKMKWEKHYDSPYGALHLAGNAAEWVFDFFDENYYSVSEIYDPEGPSQGKKGHVFRGGSYLTRNKEELMTCRRNYPRNQNMVAGCDERGLPMIGFRCAKSAGPRRTKQKPEVEKELSLEELMKIIEEMEKTKRR